MKKLIIIVSLVVVLILLGIFLYNIGKEHKIFIDNKDFANNGESYIASSEYEVWVDGEKVGRTTVGIGKRQVATVAGPGHTIVLQEVEDKEAVGERNEKSFKIKTSDYEVIINLPALVAGSENWLMVNK